MLSKAFAIPLTKLYDDNMMSAFGADAVKTRVMERIFPKNKVLENFYNFIIGSFVIFYKHRDNLVGLVQNTLEVKGLPAEFGKALYYSSSRGIEPFEVLMELGLVQNQRDEW